MVLLHGSIQRETDTATTKKGWDRPVKKLTVNKYTCLKNLHPQFLFWKHPLVCDPEKKGCKKQGAKNRVIVIFKKVSNNDPAFCNPYFFFFKVPDPKKYQADLKN